MAVRLKDIARDLGVSVVTVSKVLRDHPDISVETKTRVLQRMKELDYRPNLAARALVTGRTHIIGLVVPDLVQPFFALIASGLSRALRKNGYNLVISSSEENPDFEQKEIDQLLSRHVDALVVASAQRTAESFRRIDEQQTPYVLVDRRFAGLSANFVGMDDEALGRLGTGHLADVGCSRIAHICGPMVSTAIGRVAGYRRALKDRGIEPAENYLITLNQGEEASEKSGYEAMRKLLSLTPVPDGVFCYNDSTAMGAMQAALEAGLRIPQDIAMVGCGNAHYAEFLKVPLTSVDQVSEQIGARAAELVLSVIHPKGIARPQSVLLEPRLVVRESSCRL